VTFRRSRIRSRGSAIAEISKASRFAAGSLRLTTAGAVLVSGLVLAAPAGGALEVRLSVTPKRPSALDKTTIELRTYAPLIRADGSCCRLEPWDFRSYPFRLEAVSPEGKVSRIGVRRAEPTLWRGTVRFPRPGRWVLQLPQFGQRVSVRVGAPLPTPTPAGFAPLGRPGCAPASPADSSSQGFREVFGTAVGDEVLWALPFLPKGTTWAQPDAAVFDGLVGKEMKIVFAMTAGRTSHRTPFIAVGPDGETVEPVWRRGHTGPTWVGIPGHQWGAGFVFTRPGCWRIRVGPRGDLWMFVRS